MRATCGMPIQSVSSTLPRHFLPWCLLPRFRMRRFITLCCRVLPCDSVCCRMLRWFAVCCSVLQCVAVCCSVLQCVAVCCSVSFFALVSTALLLHEEVRYIILQCVAVCCSVLQCDAVWCSVLQGVAVCCSMLQCVAASLLPWCLLYCSRMRKCVTMCCSVW